MRSVRTLILTVSALVPAWLPLATASAARAEPPTLVEKLNAYVGCINRLSERAYDSRERYVSWVGKKGPTGKERIIYGTYTIYDTSDCKSSVEKANTLEPRDAALEAAASAYVTAVVALEPLLKEADDYYTQEDYKDDKMAKGKAMHPRLVAAWDTFASADQKLRAGIDEIQDKMAAERLTEIERSEGRNARYHVEALMMHAKRVMRTQSAERPELAGMTAAVGEYDEIVKATEAFAEANREQKIGSMFVSSAKSFLVTAKQLMRRIRDKVPYSSGEKMILNSGGGAWMVEGSPARMMRDYNELVTSYNRGASF
ncbi:YiiG family protein [Hyphomicrobium sp. CS1GBMeth3]|uniref:YiiG family protein n=1 Tax=Hyphomicrobium sp. CS1GBMeth3 TaxID=1892845 RepID=UPI000931E8E5|nr:YiiG family protein [Hyphomicrobium sp. CS1GBMeth3]